MTYIRARCSALGPRGLCPALLLAGLLAAGAARPPFAGAGPNERISTSGPPSAAGPPAQPRSVDGADGEDPAIPRSWLVRLEGASLWERIRADGQSAPGGLAPRSVADLEAQRRAIAARQEGLRSAVTDLGGGVVDDYQVVYNGLLVHATPAQAADIADLAGVAGVAPAPILHLHLANVVKTIAADRVVDQLDLDGTGVTVAVIDTGIDYTHAVFGGAGTAAAYAANDENKVEPGSFPTAKVVGGYDFAGQRYSPACPKSTHSACNPRPLPDGDPLDPEDLGHGTHVAGIVAGQTSPRVHAGVAPGARLVALKIFGNPVGAQATTDLALGAIEWVVRHNLGLDVEGAAPAGRIDVVNMSLGADWSSQMIELSQAIDAAVESGVTVVASAGNAGALAYATGSPASADLALSVASSVPSGAAGLRVSAEWSQGGPQVLEMDAIEAAPDWLRSLSDSGPVRSQLAWYGRACNTGDGKPSTPEQDVRGRVALIERGDCSYYEKVASAEKYGALGVIVVTDGSQKATMTCESPPSPCSKRLGIPAVMIDREPGIRLRDLRLRNIAVSVTLGRFENNFLADTISDFSSRGPARFDAAIKPQLTAPGSRVVSALVGSGNDGQSLSGTSMASPVAAGVAALLWQRNRGERLRLDGADVGALLMNYAEPVVKVVDENDEASRLAAVMRQGAGRVNAWRSATGRTLVRSEHGLAALGFGHLHVTDGQTVITRSLTVRNLSSQPQTYTPSAKFLFPIEDSLRGVRLRFSPERLTLPAGPAAEAELKVGVVVTAESLRAWDLRGEDLVRREEALGELEIDGFVRIEATDTRGRPIKDGDAVGVPFHILPRRHSCVDATTSTPIRFLEAGDVVPQVWANPCGAAGDVEPYALVGVDTAESAGGGAFPPRVDIDAIGLRYGPVKPGDASSPLDIAWAIHLRGSQRIPAELALRVYLDLNRDGTFDRVIFNQYGPYLDSQLAAGGWVVSHAPLVPGTLDPDITQMSRYGRWQSYDLDASTAVLSVDAEDLGLNLKGGRTAFDFAVMAIDAVDDFAMQAGFPGRDEAPDGMRQGERYTFDQAALACVALVDTSQRLWGRLGDALRLGAQASRIELGVKADCPLGDLPRQFGLFFHYPSNLPEAQLELRTGQLDLPSTPTSTPTRTATVVPPSATPTRTLTPLPPNATPTRTATVVPSSATPTRTATAAPPTPGATLPASATVTRTAGPTATLSTSVTPSPTRVATRTASGTPTATDPPTPTASRTRAATRTYTPIAETPTDEVPSATPTDGPSATATRRQPSRTPEPTLTPESSATPTEVDPSLATPSDTPIATPTATPTGTDRPTATDRPSASPTRRPSATPTRPPPTRTRTPEPSPTSFSTPPQALPDLSMREVEISQAVQQPFGGVPLVADRPTILRVNIEVGWGLRPVPGVTGRLFARRDGALLPGAPLMPFNPGGELAVPPAPDLLSMDDTLNFLLPPAWTAAGKIEAWVELNPYRGVAERDYDNNRSQDLELVFERVPPLELVLVPVEYQPGGIGPIFRPSLTSTNDYGLALIARLYPLSAVNISLHPPVAFKSSLASAGGQRGLAQAIGQLRLHEHPDQAWIAGADAASGSPGPAGPIYLGVVAAEAGLTGVLAYQGGGVALGPAGQAEAAARGIGLALGLGRVACRDGDTAGADPGYPDPRGVIGSIGLDVFRQVAISPTHFDMMSDCQPAWISSYTYQRLFERLRADGAGGQVLVQPPDAAGGSSTVTSGSRAMISDSRADAPDRVTAADPAWLITGQIHGNGTSGGLNPIEVVTDAVPVVGPGVAAGSGRYRIELRDEAARVVASYAFDPLAMVAAKGDTGLAGFGFAVAPLAGAGSVVLVDTANGGGAELARLRVASAAGAPPLTLNLGVLPPATATPNLRSVLWQIGGGDGTPARATLRFSRDGGRTWQVLLVASRETRYELDLALLGGSANGLVELIATAGAASATRQVSLGRLVNHPPRVDILGPSVIRLAAGQPVVLAGEAFDLEDGPLPNANLVWTLVQTGHTATGRTLVLPAGLPAGVYTVSLTAVDGAGAAQGARATLLVGRTGGAFLPWAVTRR